MTSWQTWKASVRAFWDAFGYFWRHPFHSSKHGLKSLSAWLWSGTRAGGRYIVAGAKRQWVAIVAVTLGLLVLLLVAGVAYWQVATYYERQMVPVDAPQQVVYLDQGWGGNQPTSDERLS